MDKVRPPTPHTGTVEIPESHIYNQPKMYLEFVTIFYIIPSLQGMLLILGFQTHIWWHEKPIVVPYVSFQGLNTKYFLIHKHHNAMI